MKISDKKKGIEDYVAKYHDVPDDLPPPEFTEEHLAEMDAEAIDVKRIRRRNAWSEKRWEEEGQKNLKIILYEKDAVANRLRYLLDEKDIEVATFAREVGMGRSTIHRYLKGEPVSEKKLLRIIDALSMSVADFCYSPQDIDEWKASLVESVSEQNDIYAWRDNLLEQLSTNDFTYQRYGKTHRLPYNYYVVLKAAVENTIRFLDLLPHDTKVWTPRKAAAPTPDVTDEDAANDTEDK